SQETARITLVTHRQLRDTALPEIRIAVIEDGLGQPLMISKSQSGSPWLSPASQVVIRGEIQAVEKLTQATGQGQNLPGFTPDKDNNIKFDWPLDLQPGLNRFRLEAKTEASPLATSEIEVFFRQPLPEVE